MYLEVNQPYQGPKVYTLSSSCAKRASTVGIYYHTAKKIKRESGEQTGWTKYLKSLF
jgi:hypothetical protein